MKRSGVALGGLKYDREVWDLAAQRPCEHGSAAAVYCVACVEGVRAEVKAARDLHRREQAVIADERELLARARGLDRWAADLEERERVLKDQRPRFRRQAAT